MIQVGDCFGFKRDGELCEGYCTVIAVDYERKEVNLTPLPEGIKTGDEMVWLGKDITAKLTSIPEP